MSVPCPVCGREYDVTLFQFGRKVACDCGARVELAPRLRAGRRGAGEARFFADAMLGRLARWMRAAGYDVAYEADIDDADLVRRAAAEGRTILTRDLRLVERRWRPPCAIVESESLPTQLRQVMTAFPIDWAGQVFTRCTRCNLPVRPASAERVARRVPARVRAEQQRFVECPGCGRIYWSGSHAARMRRALERLLD